jgi:hypothetical protein
LYGEKPSLFPVDFQTNLKPIQVFFFCRARRDVSGMMDISDPLSDRKKRHMDCFVALKKP